MHKLLLAVVTAVLVGVAIVVVVVVVSGTGASAGDCCRETEKLKYKLGASQGSVRREATLQTLCFDQSCCSKVRERDESFHNRTCCEARVPERQ